MKTISSIMGIFGNIFSDLYSTFGDGLYIVIPFLMLVGTVAMWRLFEKAGQKGWTSLVPVYNLVIVMRIVGRPDWHTVLFFVPGLNIYLFFKVHFELIESFGKKDIIDYVLLMIFNVFYIMNMGLSYEDEYKGPVYKQRKETSKVNVARSSAQVA